MGGRAKGDVPGRLIVDAPETVPAYALGMSSRIDESVFVVRTWLETTPNSASMRGLIHNLGSDRRAYFANFGSLCDFIADEWRSAEADGERQHGDGPASAQKETPR